ncbi:carbon-nitrogen hydrolase family protein [Paenibacillus sp. 1P07SE]|uniref:carbon-nitrogen hydrolase family protein n=1 Tax=Paenibacillus sp. 1P07SE TaxID=3132209 RepID=UPI0039A5F081
MSAKIGLIQVTSEGVGASVEERQDRLIAWMDETLADGADLVTMTEVFQYQEARKTATPQQLAQRHSGRFMRMCSELAKRRRAYVVPWDYEQDEKGSLYSACIVFGRNGERIGSYRKVHLTWSEQQKGLAAGRDFPVFELDIGKVGIQICFDQYFPESVRALAINGAELILYPYFGDTMPAVWEAGIRARAFENSVFIAASSISKSTFTGIVDPLGQVVATIPERGKTAVVEIDLQRPVITRTSALPGRFEDFREYLRKVRQPHAYSMLTEPRPVKEWDDILIDDKAGDPNVR